MITELAQGATHLADNDFGDNLGDGVAGPVGLLVVVLLVIATVFLVRNMNKHLRKLPESFPDPRDAATGSPAGSSPASGSPDPAARNESSAIPSQPVSSARPGTATSEPGRPESTN
jgi:hypothetical protein